MVNLKVMNTLNLKFLTKTMMKYLSFQNGRTIDNQIIFHELLKD